MGVYSKRPARRDPICAALYILAGASQLWIYSSGKGHANDRHSFTKILYETNGMHVEKAYHEDPYCVLWLAEGNHPMPLDWVVALSLHEKVISEFLSAEISPPTILNSLFQTASCGCWSRDHALIFNPLNWSPRSSLSRLPWSIAATRQRWAPS